MLENFVILNYLSENERKNLELFCQERFLSKWEILFKEWDEANSMYFLKKGSISIHKSINWQKVVLWKVIAEEIIWEMALFWRIWTRMWTAEALEDCELITIADFSIKELTNKNPVLLSKIQAIIEERIIKNKIVENQINNNKIQINVNK